MSEPAPTALVNRPVYIHRTRFGLFGFGVVFRFFSVFVFAFCF